MIQINCKQTIDNLTTLSVPKQKATLGKHDCTSENIRHHMKQPKYLINKHNKSFCSTFKWNNVVVPSFQVKYCHMMIHLDKYLCCLGHYFSVSQLSKLFRCILHPVNIFFLTNFFITVPNLVVHNISTEHNFHPKQLENQPAETVMQIKLWGCELK